MRIVDHFALRFHQKFGPLQLSTFATRSPQQRTFCSRYLKSEKCEQRSSPLAATAYHVGSEAERRAYSFGKPASRYPSTHRAISFPACEHGGVDRAQQRLGRRRRDAEQRPDASARRAALLGTN